MKGNGEVAGRLAEIVGSANLLSGKGALQSYGIDGVSPAWVVFPKAREEVGEIVSVCREESLSIIPTGSGTKIGAGGIVCGGDLLLSTRKLSRVIDQDCENLTVTLEAGALFSEIQERMRLEGIGYFIPLDPPFTDASTLGGILAANSSGPKRLLYGTARDLVLGLKVILSDGKIVSCGGKTVKNVSGYDVGKLFIGSFGSLGIIIEATLRLLPLPEEEETFVASFSESKAAFEVVKEILKSQLIPSSLEVLNSRVLQGGDARVLTAGSGYLLVAGIEGVSEAVHRQIRDLHEIGVRFHPKEMEVLQGNDQENLWKTIRNSSLRLRTSFPQSVFVKTNVPISKTGQVFALSEEITRQEGVPSALSSQAGSGILQMALLFDQSGSTLDRAAPIVDQITRHAAEKGGNLMVEAAPAPIKRQMKVWGREGSDLPLFRQLKSQLDPSSLFSPGKFVGGI